MTNGAGLHAFRPDDGYQKGMAPLAIAYTLIETAKLNRVDPQAWLTDVLGRIADHKVAQYQRSCKTGRILVKLGAFFS